MDYAEFLGLSAEGQAIIEMRLTLNKNLNGPPTEQLGGDPKAFAEGAQ